jgi:hypothetical protein
MANSVMTLLQLLKHLNTFGIVSIKLMSISLLVAKIYDGAAVELLDIRYKTCALAAGTTSVIIILIISIFNIFNMNGGVY